MSDAEMDSNDREQAAETVGKHWWWLAAACALVPWLSQPPMALWPLGFVASVPFVWAALQPAISRRQYAVLFLAALVYWAVTLQGLRHAHPAMYACWIALAAYLAVYRVLFVVALRRSLQLGCPLILGVPILWVGMECVRNYLITGVSAAMLGHTLADVPSMIQIADLGGSYAVSFVLAMTGAAICQVLRCFVSISGTRESDPAQKKSAFLSLVGVAVLLIATVAYGRYRLNEPLGEPTTTFALIGRSEKVEYFQKEQRELEIFDGYVRQSIRAAASSDAPIDVVVWPESMYTGTLPWLMGEGSPRTAEALGLDHPQMRAGIEERRAAFQFRSNTVQSMIATGGGEAQPPPHLLVGCGVVDYQKQATHMHSGLVHIAQNGRVRGWYGKTHLVMFGEYIPFVKSIPVVKNWVPEEIGLTVGPGPRYFEVGETSVSPNICIETAVERVTINHLRELKKSPGVPESIVTVTNDAWFDDSSVVQHHKRCAQLVAVACRRPILSAANNGPTCWIDSRGVIVEEIPQGGEGNIIARPHIDSRSSLVMTIGDWPARVCAAAFVLLLAYRKRRGNSPD